MELSQLSSRVIRWRAAVAGFVDGAAWLVILAAGLLTVGAAVWQAHQSQVMQVDNAASRLADAVARDVAGTVEQFDLTLRTVMEGDETPASRTLTPERRSALLFERTPRARDIAFIDVLGADGGCSRLLRPTNRPAIGQSRTILSPSATTPRRVSMWVCHSQPSMKARLA